jgi:glycosyltransferase involved in cell wall biosynthesis
VFVAKVEPSIDELLFQPDGSRHDGDAVRITAMLRPRTPRRQPFSTVDVLEQLLVELPRSVEVTTFGCNEADLRTITSSPTIASTHLGPLKRDQVAKHLQRSDVFLDMSTYQAFGRTALEAMACGCAAVVPRLGGVWDFADEGASVLAVDTFDRESAFEAVAALIQDRDRLARLRDAARESAGRYSILRAALSEYVVLREGYTARFG